MEPFIQRDSNFQPILGPHSETPRIYVTPADPDHKQGSIKKSGRPQELKSLHSWDHVKTASEAQHVEAMVWSPSG